MDSTEGRAIAAGALRAGFTLMEIMVAVAIIGIMSTMAVMGVTRMMESAKKDAAQSGVQSIKNAVTTYYLENKRYPSDLSVLVESKGDEEAILTGGEGALDDPWGTQFKMEGRGNRIVIISAGPDGEFGTDDDIRSDKVKKSGKDQ